MQATLLILCCITMLFKSTGSADRQGFCCSQKFQSRPLAADTISPLKLELEKTNFKDMNVLFIHDTAVTTAGLTAAMVKGYGELMQFMQQNELQPLKFMAWYYSSQPPWFIDIAIETNKTPTHLSARIQSRIQPGGDLLIAHTQGPYEQLDKAYAEIANWLRQNNRTAKSTPFEVYLNDPGSVKDPSELKTDIYQPLQ